MVRSTRLARLLALVAAAPVLLGSLVAAPASAAPAAPAGLSPSGVSIVGTPVLSWDAVSGATSYKVEVSGSAGFETTRWTATTVNRRAVPTVQLPTGEVWWRVRAVNGTGSGAWSVASFDRSALAGPTLHSPASGTVLQQPAEPALLAWSPVPGAQSYTVEIDDGDDFVGATSATTKTSSHVVPSLLLARPYYWRVRATLGTGINTEWSEHRSFQVAGLAAPELVGPVSSPSTTVQDVVLDWAPVPGASMYDLQVSTDVNFLTFAGGANVVNVKGTRYSPPGTLNNDQYYWRVRPIDVQGNKLDWSQVQTWSFQRNWPHQADLEYPVEDEVVRGQVFYQWSGVKHASDYQVQVSADPDFPNNATSSCLTVHTTFVPTKASECWPTPYVRNYWRVVARDDMVGVVSDRIVGEVATFSYEPDLVPLVSPADGASVELPTLTWEPVADAARYKVTITATDNGSTAASTTTAGLSYTPRSALTPGKTYRWQVQTVSNSGRVGPPILTGSQPTFTMATPTAPTATHPDPTGPAPGSASSRFPSLTWTPVVNATSYRVYVRRATSTAWTLLSGTPVYPATTDEGATWLAADTYEWFVEAHGSSGLLSAGAIGSFRITAPPAVTGQRAALTGQALASPATSCATALPDRCQNLRQTPVLSWQATPETGYYEVYLSRDKEMTNLLPGYPVEVDSNRWMAAASLADSQAGSAYFWVVLPCKYSKKCAPLTHATHAFNKLSNPVELLSPAADEQVANDVTLTWRDYLATNLDTGPGTTDSTGVHARVEAERYRVQVSADPNFQTLLDDVKVDQTTFTSTTNTYPEGPVYWRVQALDGSDNPLAWSSTRSFLKRSPVPALRSPGNGAGVAGTEPFRWHPVDFAASYDIEVYKDGDTTGSASNRVYSGNSKQVALTLTTPLPVAVTPYTWRVRRVDSAGRKGSWSDLAAPGAAFRVVAAQPVLLSPLAGAVVGATDAIFEWQGVEAATSYRFERRLAGGTSAAEVVTTAALAYAPTATIGKGQWEWRVSAIDTGGKVMSSTAWRRFTVDAAAPTVVAKRPTRTASPSANFTVTFSEPVAGVSTSTFRIQPKGSTKALAAAVTLSPDKRTATLNPAKNLRVGKVYVVQLTSGIADLSGIPLQPVSWSVRVQ